MSLLSNPPIVVAPQVAFPLLSAARRRFDIGAPRFSDILKAREVADRINATRDLAAQPQLAVTGGLLAAASLLDEIFAHAIALYVAEAAPRALEEAPAFLEERIGASEMGPLYKALQTDYAAPTSRPDAVEYVLRLRLANENPALKVATELFDESALPQLAYSAAQLALHEYFDSLPPFGLDAQPLLDLLYSPLRAHPDSIEKQLRFLLEGWGHLVEPFMRRILLQLDVLSEENKPTFFGPGPALVPDYKNRAVGYDEYEAFSLDKAWMPEVVLLAKNTYVWLDQLSKKFGRHIYRLDQVPDEELDEMAARGFTGLWLIGLWQRSQASQRIKQMCGNPDAVASAYSLHAYDIAWELGGQEAMDNLASRAARRGLRMASDMVPNHMAIDSRWVVEHPDWFLSLPHSPYPQYSFEGPDLSGDGRVGIFLENHYYSKSDASVVFKRVDKGSGEARYVYHGNDGTSMPWNDTAQLNYLMPAVREAVIQTILHVARHFPIIRFDAAMTLAKRHYHRLWFPSPGEGGAIPTRAGQGLTPDEFDQAFPQEFWREVVERVAQEVPDTLLLAEAFWMMESYFVRTLGMHRVYNSAFMNMLRDEKNAEYRLVMKNTLEFDPDILGRFVNFMNNPDEKTAVEQFGKDDKYFGVCTLMATLPGLPMFGHGQLEGYEEKYGMEYPRAYWKEQPDAGLIAHHERVIFPLLHRRALFAGSENFTLFDFWTNEGYVNEDVFAYSNRRGEDRALVVYHNRFADAAGWIKNSVGFAQKGANGERPLVHRSLAEALGLRAGERSWAIFRDNASGLEYLRRSRDLNENGLFVQLNAYGCHVFLDWREVQDTSGLYELLATRLAGQGVASVETALREMVLEPLRNAFLPLVEDEMWRSLLSPTSLNGRSPKSSAKATKNLSPAGQQHLSPDATVSLDVFETKLRAFAQTARQFCDLKGDVETFVTHTRARLERVLAFLKPPPGGKKGRVGQGITADLAMPGALWGWGLLSQIGLLGAAPATATKSAVAAETTSVTSALAAEVEIAAHSRLWLDEWLLIPLVEEALHNFGVDAVSVNRAAKLIRLLTAHVGRETPTPFALASALMSDESVHRQLGVNRFEGVTWFDKGGFEATLAWLQLAAALEDKVLPVAQLKRFATQSGYRVVRFLELTRFAPAIPKKPRLQSENVR